MTDQESDPKIIVDDDWKAQVQKEKEELEHSPDADEAGQQIPEASFGLLVTTLTTQALASLGFVPNPATGQAEINLDLAKHFIDSLAVLEEKTKGNLTTEESSLLDESLHQLRMAFVAQNQAPAAPATDEAKPTIELP